MSGAAVGQVGVAEIGVTGLAVMGRNLARNFARHGYTVALHNRSFAKTQSLVADHGDEGTFVASETMADFVASLARPRSRCSWNTISKASTPRSCNSSRPT